MFSKYILPGIAIVLVIFAASYALYMQRPVPETPPPVPPPLTPYGDTVAGAGMVEASTHASGTGNIAVGSQLPGVITKIGVRIRQKVEKDQVLIELDPRQTEADLKVREANLTVTKAQVLVAEANVRLTKDQYDRAKRLRDQDGISEQEFVTAEQNHLSAQAQLAVARANVEQAQAQVDQDKTTLDLLKIKAPVKGMILQVNVRLGEYVSTAGGQAPILMGSVDPLHVRVNIDEEDLPRLKLHAPARAKLRGDPLQQEIPLTYVRLEPYVVPKTSLTGANTERVDTRVVQVIYKIESDHPLVRNHKVMVGQLVDVFIDARPVGTATKFNSRQASIR